jgi:DNA-binding IclR family transcriptional regulator
MSAEVVDTPCEVQVVKSAVRTLKILELFDEMKAPLNVVTVSDALGYPQSSTAALLRSLVTMGYLHYDAQARTFVSTARVSLLGNWINPALFEQGALTGMMRSVAERTEQMVLLASRNGDFAQYIHVLDAPDAVLHRIGLGAKRPLATSGVGQILLAGMPDEDVRRLFHRINAYRDDAGDRINVPDLMTRLDGIRKAGFSSSRNGVCDGLGVIAVAIPNGFSNRPLAVGICGACQTLDDSESAFVAILREEMARFLGADDGISPGSKQDRRGRDKAETLVAATHAA